MEVPAKYVEEIYSAPTSRVRWIRNDEFESNFAGFIPELNALVKAKCGTHPDQAEPSHQPPKVNVQVQQDCETKIREELASSAFKDAAKGTTRDVSGGHSNKSIAEQLGLQRQ
jgi:hypothetical protein